MVAGLGGCSSVPDAANPVEWYKGTRDWIMGEDEKKTATTEGAKPAPGADKPFPRLDTVPDRPPETTEAERKRMAGSLIADRETARYSDEEIRRQTSAIAADTRSGSSPASAATATPAPLPALEPPKLMVETQSAPAPVARRGPAVTNQTASVDPAAEPRAARLPPVSSVPRAAAPQPAQASAALPQVPVFPPPPPAISPVIAAGQPIPVTPSPSFGEAPLPGAEFPYAESAGLPPNVRIAHSQPYAAPVMAHRFSPRFPAGATASAGPRIPTPTLPPFASLPPELDVSPSAGFAPGAVIPPSAGLTPGAGPAVTIRFGVGSAKIGPQGQRQIRQAYEAWRSLGGRIHVVGHASSRTRNLDRTRHELANFRVSHDRARAVAQELIRLGVDPGQIVVSAVSDHQPAFVEVMPAGEAGNRRAEIIFAN